MYYTYILLLSGIAIFFSSPTTNSMHQSKNNYNLKNKHHVSLDEETYSNNFILNHLKPSEDYEMYNENEINNNFLNIITSLSREEAHYQLNGLKRETKRIFKKKRLVTSTENDFYGCSDVPYPPEYIEEIPEFVINLDDEPEERWREVVTKMKDKVQGLIDFFEVKLGRILISVITKLMRRLITPFLPEEYRRELEGIANISGVDLGMITLYNVCYEVTAMCTSIVMQGSDGQIYHGRNLDFGRLMGYDKKNQTYYLTELLRPLTIKVNFVQSGKLLYSAVTYAGYTGVLTGIKKDFFSLTINERFKVSGLVGLLKWTLGRREGNWLGLVTRRVMETAKDYEEAKEELSKTTLVSPVYFILAGNSSRQGTVITRGRQDVNVWDLSDEPSRWYLLETNSDPWTPTSPTEDPRRYYGNLCMDKLGASRPYETLYKVLSTRPVLNKETTFTALMQASTGDLQVFRRDCADPCS